MNTLKKLNYKTTTYKYDNHFLIDIVETNDEYESYLYDKSYGIKSLIFGMLKKDITASAFLDAVLLALEIETYIDDYIEEFY